MMLLPLGFLPEHVWQVGGSALALGFMLMGASLIVVSRRPRGTGIAYTGGPVLGYVALGVAVVIAAFAVDAEPACGGCGRGHWGGAGGVMGLCVWLLVMAAICGMNLRRIWKDR